MNTKEKAVSLIRNYKNNNYILGINSLDKLGKLSSELGTKAEIVANCPESEWMQPILSECFDSLKKAVAASSAAHLTKYSNITNVATGQKMLIVDPSIIPHKALFDIAKTISQPLHLTLNGVLNGVSHCLEVLMGISDEKYEQTKEVCLTGVELIVNNLKNACENPKDLMARETLGLGTDLGGVAIMIGGTNGAHLNSFSMTDILSHGRACAIMNPNYLVFFAPVLESRLIDIAIIYINLGYLKSDVMYLKGKDLGEAIAEGMIKLSREIGFPATLNEVPGFTSAHISRCLNAAKNPKLDSKLKNMPIPLNAGIVDEYMGSILEAATIGDFSKIKAFKN